MQHMCTKHIVEGNNLTRSRTVVQGCSSLLSLSLPCDLILSAAGTSPDPIEKTTDSCLFFCSQTMVIIVRDGLGVSRSVSIHLDACMGVCGLQQIKAYSNKQCFLLSHYTRSVCLHSNNNIHSIKELLASPKPQHYIL